MKLGLITDIHESVEFLRLALARFEKEQVDQIVVIGDVFETGEKIEETCRLLAEADAVGVWGNHDFGLCVEPDAAVRARYSSVVLDYMTSLRPRLEIGGCYFAHVEPWLNPEVVRDLWYFEGPPDEPAKLQRIFEAVPHRIIFAGHYHKWLLATPQGMIDWQGAETVHFSESQRYFAIIGGLCDGQYAIFDTETAALIPYFAGTCYKA